MKRNSVEIFNEIQQLDSQLWQAQSEAELNRINKQMEELNKAYAEALKREKNQGA